MNDSQSQQILEKLQAYIEDHFSVQFDGEKINADTDLFYEGVIDSFGIVDLVGFIETTFSVALTNNDMTSPLLSTLNGQVKLIIERQS